MNYLTHPNTKVFLIYATIYMIIWVIEMRMALTFKARLKSNPQTLEDGLTNVMKFGVNRTKDNVWLIIFFVTMLIAYFQGIGVNMWLEKSFPLMDNDSRTYWTYGITGAAHVFLLSLKPPSLIKKFRTRFIAWMISLYVIFCIFGWLPLLNNGIYR